MPPAPTSPASGHYCFRHEWSIPLPRDELFDVLADVEHYPTWWPQVRAVLKVNEDTAHVVVRSVLPYSLDLVLVRAVEDRSAGLLEVRVHGQLEGWSRWTLRRTGSGTSLLYEQEVMVQGLMMRVASTLARPLLTANHALMMRGAREGLLSLGRVRDGRTPR